MKPIHFIQLRVLFILCLSMIIGGKVSTAQTIHIGGNYDADTLIQPFNGQKIYQLQVFGKVKLHSDTSLLRVVMVDQYGDDFLVYETYPLITANDTFNIVAGCDETCYMSGLIATSLRIDIINSSF